MYRNKYRNSAAAALGVIAMASPAAAAEGGWGGSYGSSASYYAGSQDPYAPPALDRKIAILRQKVKYVFVIFHENESFDHYFGTYPGANGLFEAPPGFTPANQTPSFKQRLLDTTLTIVGPSTPNAIAIIAGQSGQTQWAEDPSEGAVTTYANSAFPNVEGASYQASPGQATSNAYVPVVSDPGPFPGSNLDTNKVKPPYNPNDESPTNPALNLTFATQPLSYMGSGIEKIIATDPNPAADLLDVQQDIKEIAAFNRPVQWGWYQQGFNSNDALDPYEAPGTPTAPTSSPIPNSGYVLHHNAPQYFAYLADNPQVLNSNLHGAKDFFNAVEGRTLARRL